MLIKSNNRYIINPCIDDLLNSLKTGVIQLNNKNEITYISKGITTLAGLPAATEKEGISFVTTDPAPIIEQSPILTPGSMIDL